MKLWIWKILFFPMFLWKKLNFTMGYISFLLGDKYLFFLGIKVQTKADFSPCTWFHFTLPASSLPWFSLILFPHKSSPSHFFHDCKMSFHREGILTFPAVFPGSNFPRGIRIFSYFFLLSKKQIKKGLLDSPTWGGTSIYTEKRKFSFRNLTCMEQNNWYHTYLL